MEVNSMETNSMDSNLFVVDTSPAHSIMSPFYICTLLRMLNFNPHTDRCSVSTKQLAVKIYRGV